MGTHVPSITFAHLLQRYRRAVGLTQEELAERAHLSVRGISNLEQGVRRVPHRRTTALLAEALGLPDAEREVFEAAARGLGEPGSTEQPAFLVPTNLPLALTSFIGRERELPAVRRLLGETRLLTLTGTGGCGKTRLALEAVRSLAREAQQAAAYPDGIWLVELAPLGDGTLVPRALAAVLGVRERPGQVLLDNLTAFLCPKQALLLLDNCEHLVMDCAALVAALLRVCPRLTILATSREALGIGGERTWRVPSLGLPDPRGRLTLEQAATCEAVQLFVQRAQEVRADFALIGRQVILAVQVCRRLDGIPLAIELAAARLSALSLDHLSTRLDDRFRLLTGGSRSALPRQQTLRATLDWSYDLLDEPEQRLLSRLSVFAGGWTLEAAETVGADDGLAPEEIVDLLTGLVNKSLVLLNEGNTGARYALLETVRQYGSEKLAATGEVVTVQTRHLHWYLRLAEQAEAGMGGPEQEEWLERLEEELENLRAALTWSSQADGLGETGLRLATALRWFWGVRGYLSEGQRWLEGLLRDAGAPTVRARALDALGEMLWLRADSERALALFEESFVLHGRAGNGASAAHALLAQGMLLVRMGEHPRAVVLIEEALLLLREHGEKHGVAWSLGSLGMILHLQGVQDQAATHFQESLALFQELGDRYGSAAQVANLARVARMQGDHERAKRLYRESLTLRLDLVDKGGFANCFEGVGMVTFAGGHPSRAVRLFGAAYSLREAIGGGVPVVDRTARDRTVVELQAALGEDAFASAWAAGQAMRLEEAIEFALEETSAAE